MRGRGAIWILLAASGAASCGKGTSASGISSVTFSPNPATVASGICTSTATIAEISGHSMSLVSLEVFFTGADGAKTDFALDSIQLEAQFGSLTIPANGTVSGSLSFDLGSKGVKLPAAGTVVAIGTGRGGAVTDFIGSLSCNGS
ncbi:MAG: hypothetical protein V1495_04355 [Pseudomonadota bacterium]